MTVKTRFAPSPTGYLHIGGVRTALFSWLYARHHGGAFVLRVEDTDRERSSAAAVDAIIDGMAWLGLDADEGPYFQMDRFEHYQAHAARLLDDGHAYRCYCSREELDQMRAAQQARGETPRYDGRCRERKEPVAGVESVVRFRTPRAGSIAVEDLIHGTVEFNNAELDDLVILRPDGVPTFHFGVVVDDGEMGITHVIRGDDHLNNTPRQLHMIDALGFQRPVYAHLPMILGPDGAKLSKRHGAVNVLEYREQGILPDAMLNYLVRLGWSHGDQEIFTRAEMVALFDLQAVNTSAARMDPDKLNWLNQQYIRTGDVQRILPELRYQFDRLDIDTVDGPDPGQVLDAYRERAVNLRALAEGTRYLYTDVITVDPTAARRHLVAGIREPLAALVAALSALPAWEAEGIHKTIGEVAATAGIGFGKLGQPVRVAVTGGTVSPPIDATLALLGRERTLARLGHAIDSIGVASH